MHRPMRGGSTSGSLFKSEKGPAIVHPFIPILRGPVWRYFA